MKNAGNQEHKAESVPSTQAAATCQRAGQDAQLLQTGLLLNWAPYTHAVARKHTHHL